jgi:hypothetical protein
MTLSDAKTHVISTIATLAADSSTPGHGRWMAPGEIVARVGFSDGMNAVFTADTANGGGLVEVARKGGTVSPINLAGATVNTGAEWASFGLPALDATGGITFTGRLALNIGGVTAADGKGIFRQDKGSTAWTEIARVGGPTDLGDGSTFAAFNDPVSNGNETVAFTAVEHRKTGNKTALWNSSATENGGTPVRSLQRIAAAGESAPETGGGLFGNFLSLALPGGENAGPVFTATLAHGPGRTTSANNTGLWAVDYDGNLRLLLRTGFPLPGAAAGSPAVKTFTVLKAAALSPGQPRSYNDHSEVFCNVTYVNGSTALVQLLIP